MNPPNYNMLYPPPPPPPLAGPSSRTPSPRPVVNLSFPPPPRSPIHNLPTSGRKSPYLATPSSQPYIPPVAQTNGGTGMLSVGSHSPTFSSPRSGSHSRTSSFLKGVGTFLGEALKEAAERVNERAASAEAERKAAAEAHAERLAAEQAEADRIQAERLQVERYAAQSAQISAPETCASRPNDESVRVTEATHQPSTRETEEAMTSLLNMLKILSKPSDTQTAPSIAANPGSAGTVRPTSLSMARPVTPAGWRSHSFPIMGVDISLPANYTLEAGVSGPGSKVITVPSGRRDAPFSFSFCPIYSRDGVGEFRERQNRTYITNGGSTVTLVSAAQPASNFPPNISATSSHHRNALHHPVYMLVLSSHTHGNGVWINGRTTNGADAAAMRAMTDTIARSIRFHTIQSINAASHLLVGSYIKAASERSNSYYQTASFHETTSLYLFPDGYYVLVFFSKTFGFAAGMSGMSASNTKTESGYWDSEGTVHRGIVTLRELGEVKEAGVEHDVRVCAYETGTFGVVIQMNNKTLRRKGPLRLEDFHSL